jgi:hypothetical protein
MDRFVTVTTVRLDYEAQCIKSLFESADVTCLISGSNAAGVIGANNLLTTTWEHPLGGIHIKVPERDLATAKELLQSLESDEPTPNRLPWHGIITGGLKKVPLPFRLLLIVFGSLYLGGAVWLLLWAIFQNLS